MEKLKAKKDAKWALHSDNPGLEIEHQPRGNAPPFRRMTMTPTEKLRFSRQRYGKTLRALDAVRNRNMVGIGEPKMVRLGSSTIAVYPDTFDANADERARLCRRANRLMRISKMLANRYSLSMAL